jgi:hypothetical protein
MELRHWPDRLDRGCHDRLQQPGDCEVARDYFTHADPIRDLIVHDRAQVVDAKTPDDAQAVLGDLALKSTR